MRLIHYSTAHLTEVRDVPQPEGFGGRGDKPSGLWVSVEGDDDWRSWCEGNDFRLGHLACPTEVVLHDDTKILHLQGAAALKLFHREWAADHQPGTHRWERDFRIRWADLSKRYDGIIIAPYVWSMRLDNGMPWYYSWDCASGCIWRSRAVRELRPLADACANAETDVLEV